MKRLVTAILLLVGVLATSAASAQQLTFWHYWDGANGQVLQTLIERYQAENPGVTIEAVFVPGGELVTRLQTAIQGRQVPTMAISDLVAMPLLIGSGALAPLDDRIAASGLDLDDYFPGPLVYGMRDGRRYSLPVSASNLALFWNKELFEQAGLDPDVPPETWEELVEYGRIIRDRTGAWGYELFTEGGEGTSWQWQVFLWSAGGDLVSDDLQEVAFNSPAGEHALQTWVDLVHTHGVSTIAPWGLFGRGEAAMVMDGSWMTQFFPMQVDFELGTAIFPRADDGLPASNLGGEQVFVFASDPETEGAAWDFIEWFSSTETQVEWSSQTGFMPIRASVAEHPDYTSWVADERPLLQPFVDAMPHARARPPIERYPRFSDTLAEYVLEAVHGRMTPAQALGAAEIDATPLLR
jgi:multiple sugar transport system substrate-binding protein